MWVGPDRRVGILETNAAARKVVKFTANNN